MRSAAFFDRDGTINVDFGHVYRPEDLVFITGIPEQIKQYNQEHIPVLVVTNQPGIAKGYYSVDDMHRFHDYLNQQLRLRYDAYIDAFYYCPHHPDFTGDCDCRKPRPGMLLQAAKEWGLSLQNCIMYGDSQKDRLAAAAAGISNFVLVRSGTTLNLETFELF
mgnify:CR=1 FL=1